jgi:hypothetical protein
MNVENYGKRQIKYINLILICRKIHDIILFLNFGWDKSIQNTWKCCWKWLLKIIDLVLYWLSNQLLFKCLVRYIDISVKVKKKRIQSNILLFCSIKNIIFSQTIWFEELQQIERKVTWLKFLFNINIWSQILIITFYRKFYLLNKYEILVIRV